MIICPGWKARDTLQQISIAWLHLGICMHQHGCIRVYACISISIRPCQAGQHTEESTHLHVPHVLLMHPCQSVLACAWVLSRPDSRRQATCPRLEPSSSTMAVHMFPVSAICDPCTCLQAAGTTCCPCHAVVKLCQGLETVAPASAASQVA
jgi:hypothetical protein